MERLLITKTDIPYAATVAAGTLDSLTTKDQIDVLKEGSIVAFEKNGTKVTAAGSFTKTDTKGVFALGMPAPVNNRTSVMVNWDTLEYTKTIYSAASKQVTVVGDDGVVALTTGAIAADAIGTQFTATAASTAGDFASELIDDATGVAITGELVLGQTYTVYAAGTPTWGGGTLTSSLAGTLVIGSKVIGAGYGVEIVDLQKENWERRKYDVSTIITDTGITDAAMLAVTAAAINAHPVVSLLVVATVATGDAGIVLTSVNEGEKFQVLPQGLYLGTTVTSDGSGLSQVAQIGQGTNAQILALEASTNSIEGKTSTAQRDQLGEVWTVPSLVEVGVNYTVYVLTWTDQRSVAYVSNASNPSHKTLNIVVPTGYAAGVTVMDNVLGDLGTLIA